MKMKDHKSLLEWFESIMDISSSDWANTDKGIQWTVDILEDEETTAVVSFDSTNGKAWESGWITNYNFFHRKAVFTEDGQSFRGHRGFINAYKEMRADLIEKTPSDVKRIWITGYSQGSAIATLAYKDLKHKFPEADIECITFASPRVFGSWTARKLRKTFKDNFLRVFVRGDTVTHLPPAILGFSHVGKSQGAGILGALLFPLTPVLRLIMGSVFHHPRNYKRLLK